MEINGEHEASKIWRWQINWEMRKKCKRISFSIFSLSSHLLNIALNIIIR